MYKILIYGLLLIFGLSCTVKTTAPIADTSSVEKVEETAEVYEEEFLDTLEIFPEKVVEVSERPIYNPTYTKEIDLIHTKLDVRFDWEKEHVLGKASLTLKPWFYPLEAFALDAKNFDIHSLKMNGRTLKYDYDGERLTILLGRTFTKNEQIIIDIEYTAKPSERNEIGGSAAITSDKGLFFINADGADAEKPKQIWTQGETENNSRWFPTIDKPNERTTQEISITVDTMYETLSNGKRLASINNGDGTRTDKYKQDKPHAPYLFMLAVGDFAVKKDSWRGIPLEYMVEKQFGDYAEKIFPYTPEMLTFFSDKLSYPYPWDKYSQIVVRDYVSGAMENTSAVIFGEFMQLPEGDLVDELMNEKIVAHEMMHHWFGDLVTCESWANLTLNEGFANYSEYLWLEHFRGKDEADAHWVEELEGYFSQAISDRHPLIHYGYEDKEDMFDAHSYNKGGMILHMLRNELGDEAFFASCEKYLKDNEYTEVEVDELRMAFEDLTGQDLNWFFDQWFLGSGHPELEVSHSYDASNNDVILKVVQTQTPPENVGVFRLPVVVDLYKKDGSKVSNSIVIDQREQTFTFPMSEAPALVNFDAKKILLATINHKKSKEELVFQFNHANTYRDKIEAVNELTGTPYFEQIAAKGLKDDYHGIRLAALENMEPAETNQALYLDIAKNDKHSSLRSMAFELLAGIGSQDALDLAESKLKDDASNAVRGSALTYLSMMNPEKAIGAVEQLKDIASPSLLSSIAQLYASTGSVDKMDYLISKISNMDGESVFTYFGSMAGLALGSGEPAVLEKVVNALGTVGNAENNHSLWRRFGSTRTLVELSSVLPQQLSSITDENKASAFKGLIDTIKTKIQTIKSSETNDQLKGLYENL